MVVGVPIGATWVERRAVEEVCRFAGASEAHLIEEPMVAAIGAGLPVHAPVGSLVVDIGGGITEVALISLGEVVAWRSIPVGGDDFDEAIIKHVKREHGLLISKRTAETVKRQIGSAFPTGEDTRVAISGRDAGSMLPRTAVLTREEIRSTLSRPVASLIEAVKETLGGIPPELSSDIFDRGTVLVGGGALLGGLDERLREETQIPAQVAELPITCVAAGIGAWLEDLNDGGIQEVTRSWQDRRQARGGHPRGRVRRAFGRRPQQGSPGALVSRPGEESTRAGADA
jgi:rod shape-determining protein MreB and related proteins